MSNQEIADELALADHLCSFLYGTPEYWRFMARRVEQMRPTCDVEAAAEALLPTYLHAYALSVSMADLRAEPEDYEFLLERCRGMVRAVLAHVHPEPREKKG